MALVQANEGGGEPAPSRVVLIAESGHMTGCEEKFTEARAAPMTRFSAHGNPISLWGIWRRTTRRMMPVSLLSGTVQRISLPGVVTRPFVILTGRGETTRRPDCKHDNLRWPFEASIGLGGSSSAPAALTNWRGSLCARGPGTTIGVFGNLFQHTLFRPRPGRCMPCRPIPADGFVTIHREQAGATDHGQRHRIEVGIGDEGGEGSGFRPVGRSAVPTPGVAEALDRVETRPGGARGPDRAVDDGVGCQQWWQLKRRR
jgi:hypothetical protein